MKCAKYAIKVCFQQSSTPVESFVEGRLYFSGKHSLYELKTGASVTSTGKAIFVSNHVPSSLNDKVLF